MNTTDKFSQLIRDLLASTGRSTYQLSYDARLKDSAIRNFLHGKKDLRMKSVDKLIAAAFPNGVRIVPNQPGQTATA